MEPFYKPDKEVLSRNYWDRPPNENVGDADVSTIYLAIGEALTAWELLEETLEQIFTNVTETNRASNSPVKRAFGAVESGAVRRKMIFAAAEAYFGGHWDPLTGRRAWLARCIRGRTRQAVA